MNVIEQKISNDPQTGFDRIVVITGISAYGDYEQGRIIGYVKHIKNGQEIEKFRQPLNSWYIRNGQVSRILDENTGLPIPNPNFNPELPENEENYPYMTAPSFDYFFGIFSQMIAPLLQTYIAGDDSLQAFDREDYFKQ